MKYDWIDYSSIYEVTVDSWLDEEAQRFTGCDGGFDTYYQYWVNEPDTKLGENFWVKIIFANSEPIGVMTIALHNSTFIVSEFIIRPDKRGKHIGSSVLVELLTYSKYILGSTIKDAEAVIFPDNIASQKAFEKAGFIFYSEHPDGDAWNYRYHDNTCYCGHDCSKCVTYIATQRNDDNLRRRSQSFYTEKFNLDIPLEKFNCNGGRSNKIFELCKECSFIQCCKQHDIDSCSKCPEYPCKEISDYQAKYVNKCNQI